MDIKEEFKVKFGLNHSPTNEELNKWLIETENNLTKGLSIQLAGERAAENLFKDYQYNIVWLNESLSDTIAALLAELRKKVKKSE